MDDFKTRKQKARDSILAELRRRKARTDLGAWCEHALAPFGQAPAAHHRLLIRELEAIASGANDRLMIFMPPGSAKSTYASVLFPAWYLARNPRLNVIGASHTADLAESFSRKIMGTVRDHVDTLGYGLETESVGAWITTTGGEYKAAGVGGPITGRRADLAIIDDPVKSRADAESPTYRDKAWNWFLADLRTRLKPRAAIVLIMTRWHQDDLGGRLLQSQPERWRTLQLPARAGEDDPLGREPGEWLWSDDAYGYGAELRSVLAEYENSGGMRDWWALYEQSPRILDGGIFKIGQLGTIDAIPADVGTTVRAWDLAATADTGARDADYTVGLKLAKTAAGGFVILDVVRFRGGPDEVEAAIKNTADRDGKSVTIGLPQDPGQAGKSQLLYLTRRLAGYKVDGSPESGDKAERAMPVASQMNVGNVAMVRANWNALFVDELAGFPSAAHDDQADALSRAFSMLVAPPAPAHRVNVPIRPR